MRQRIGRGNILARIRIFMKISDLVRQLLTMEHVKQEDLARDMGVTQATVSRWKAGSEPRGPQRDKLISLARSKGYLGDDRERPRRSANSDRFASIPVLSWVSAGKLADSTVEMPLQDVPKIAVADLGEGDFFALRVSGTSMDRISPDKSVLVVNRAQRALQEGKPYIFSVRGEATYKLWRGSPPRLEPYSTDPSNEPIYVDKRRGVTVIGRVRRSILDL